MPIFTEHTQYFHVKKTGQNVKNSSICTEQFSKTESTSVYTEEFCNFDCPEHTE